MSQVSISFYENVWFRHASWAKSSSQRVEYNRIFFFVSFFHLDWSTEGASNWTRCVPINRSLTSSFFVFSEANKSLGLQKKQRYLDFTLKATFNSINKLFENVSRIETSCKINKVFYLTLQVGRINCKIWQTQTRDKSRKKICWQFGMKIVELFFSLSTSWLKPRLFG